MKIRVIEYPTEDTVRDSDGNLYRLCLQFEWQYRAYSVDDEIVLHQRAYDMTNSEYVWLEINHV